MAFINAFNEPDVPRSSSAVSGMYRAGYAARMLVGSVLVTCRCLAVVRVLRPACSGAPFGLFRWISVAHSTTTAVGVSGCLLGWYRRSRARYGKEISTAFLLDAKFES